MQVYPATLNLNHTIFFQLNVVMQSDTTNFAKIEPNRINALFVFKNFYLIKFKLQSMRIFFMQFIFKSFTHDLKISSNSKLYH
jgi:hypothetical protein